MFRRRLVMPHQRLLRFLQCRFGTIAAFPLLCALVHLAAHPRHPAEVPGFGLPVGHLTSILSKTLDFVTDAASSAVATIRASSSSRRVDSSSIIATTKPAPSLDDVKPVVLSALTHRDWSHFVANFVFYVTALSNMRVPSFISEEQDDDEERQRAEDRRGGNEGLAGDWLGLASGRRVWRRTLFLSFILASGHLAAGLCVDANAERDARSITERVRPSGGGGDSLFDAIANAFAETVGAAHEQIMTQHTVVVGASGALFSLAGYNMLYRPTFASVVSGAVCLLSGGEVSTTSQAAHLGGFCWGAVVGLVARVVELRLRD